MADDELRQLVDDIGRRSYDANFGKRRLPEVFDAELWQNLEETGLTRLTTQQEAGPGESAVVLAGLARRAAAVPIAETDLLACWLAGRAGIEVPAAGPLTLAIGTGGTAAEVPWPRDSAMVVADRSGDGISVGLPADPQIGDVGYNLAGEPRGTVRYDTAALVRLDAAVGDELMRRGAWARCVQIIGTFDAALELTVAHTSQRVQFGRPLSKFQAVQHSLAAMAGEIERARAATDLATAAVTEYGFAAAQADYAVTAAKVAVGRAVTPVTTIAHQLHGAIGVTVEHQLWSATMRARIWSDEFGSTASQARRLGRLTLAADDPWDVLISCP
ncbi:acyl-CoA dehydrogenase domain-containing protein [Mycolicibacterium canariasense]|uniref:Acyl-CoA dehydrogenase domain-containing protein n=1 Tax=Mycolicibacterium canariasense TaxID=228230 RepID=A0A124E3E0_MYCCR|nr:acyl-CoA dehydrogenase family protein [Mycolicibacterium canariasense]MCV7207565.1 acyl-CoA dehydrogenase [Mycolicibacterium canariasense]ORV08797.1 acyl-CoA dehydrogenase [Mycolicibacterium canariasense]GAS99675.1 acyl-CoA dehydrogenase domain-containing protein [Mycolicibacterium canariasense]